MENPIVITLDTNLNENSYRFLKSLSDNSWPFRVIGTDKKWKSFLHRTIEYRDELISIQKMNPKQLCVISDCKDVICLRTPNKFKEIFDTFNSNIVVSSELLCAGYSDHTFRHPKDLEKYNCTPILKYWKFKGYSYDNLPIRKYVNAGLISGYVNDLIQMYEWIISKGYEINIYDDQILMGMYINEHPTKIDVDINIKLLHTSVFGASGGYVTKYQIEDSPSIAEILGRTSFFLHLPGLGIGKGNMVIYNIISTIIDSGYNAKTLAELYNIQEETLPLNWCMEDEMLINKSNEKS